MVGKKRKETCQEVVQQITWRRTVFIDLQLLCPGISEQIRKAVFSSSFPEPTHSNKPDRVQTFDPAVAKSQFYEGYIYNTANKKLGWLHIAL